MSLLKGNIDLLDDIESALEKAERHFDRTKDSNVFLVRNSLVYCRKILLDSIDFEKAKGEGK